MGMRERVFWCQSVSVTRVAFQACSIDHSDVSPFRINNLRSRVEGDGRDCDKSSNVPRSLTGFSSIAAPLLLARRNDGRVNPAKLKCGARFAIGPRNGLLNGYPPLGHRSICLVNPSVSSSPQIKQVCWRWLSSRRLGASQRHSWGQRTLHGGYFVSAR
jgi:hypothetical protein